MAENATTYVVLVTCGDTTQAGRVMHELIGQGYPAHVRVFDSNGARAATLEEIQAMAASAASKA